MKETINYQIGDVVEHIQTKKIYFVIEINWQEQIVKCRTKSHEVFFLNAFELTLR